MLPKDAACVAETLRANGYSTAAFGKWHNTPDYELSAAGPFDHWPTGLGFDYWYGFHGGEASQWNTPLYENTTPIEKPHAPAWHFSEAIAQRAISWIGQQKAAAPDRPFFIYLAPGAAHAPHHVAREWADKYKGAFDHGWDRQREITFENQKRLGVIPEDAKLTPRPAQLPAWEGCSADEQRLYARMQEVFAGFLEHVDVQIGKVVDALEAMGLRDDTLIIYEVGDNGPSAEGSLTGTLNNGKTQCGFVDDVATMLTHIDELGGPKHENHYPVPWCWAGSSPFQGMKQVASHFGGTRNPLVISWPARIEDKGGLRTQFHHVIDLVPTILEAARVPEPREVNGVVQRPIEGVSMVYTWDDANAPDRHTTQYFEMFGNRALYHDGWLAACRHGRLPWETTGSTRFDDDVWELYNVEDDFTQADDLANRDPKRLEQLQELFVAEARRYNVLPLDDRFVEREDPSMRPNRLRGKTRFVYLPGAVRIPEPSAPNTKNVDHTIVAEIDIPEGGAEGVLVCCGGETAGWTLFIKDGRLCWEHNWFGDPRYKVTSHERLAPGHHIVSAHVEVEEEDKPGTGGTVILHDGEAIIGVGMFEQQVAYRYTVNETFDVGCDTVTPVSDDYSSPFAFTGTLHRVTIDITEATFDEVATQVNAKLAVAIP